MDEIKIKALIDAADSAKTIQELKKALRELKSAAVEVGEGSKYFEQITAAAGGVSDRIGDLNAQVKNLGDDLFKLRGTIQIGQGIAAGFSIAQGAAALFGSENEAVEQSIMKVQAAMGILQGVQAVGEILQKETAATLLLQNTYRAIKVALLGEEATATATATTATVASAAASTADATAKAAEATATGAATVAQEGLNTAMKANPVMLVVGAIVAAVAALAAFASGNKEAAEAQKALNKSLNDMRLNAELETKAFQGAIAALKEMKTGSVEREIAIKNINAQYGTTLKNLTDEKDFLKQVNAEVLNYTTYAKARLTTKMNEARAENYMKQAQEERYKISEKQKNLDYIRDKQGAAERANNLILAEQMRQTAMSIQAEINSIKKVALGYEAKADKVLKINGDLLSKESAANEAARKKEEADEAARLKREEEQRRKALAKKVADNKKTNDKLLSDQEKFVQDYTDVEKEIYQVNVDIAEQNTILLGDTLEARLKAIQDAAQQEIDAENQKYAELLAKHVDVEKKKNEAEVAAKVKGVKKKTDAEITAEVEKNEKLIALKKAMGEREALITKNSQIEMAKITEEEEKKRQENIKKLTQQSLNTDEYRRFMDYLALIRTGSSFTKKELRELRKELKDTVIEGTVDKPGLTQTITKQLVVGIERDRMNTKKQIDDINQIIEESKDNPALTDYVNQQIKKLKELEAEYENINTFGPQIDRFINHFKIPQGLVEDYTKALDEIAKGNKEYAMSAESVLIPDALSMQLDRLFAFQRTMNSDEIKDNKEALTQLAVIYKAKYNTIVKNEEAITEALQYEFDKQQQAITDFTKSIMTGDNSNGEIINSLLDPTDFDALEKRLVDKFGELGSIYLKQARLLEQKAKEKGSPIDFQNLITDTPEKIQAPVFKVEPNPNQGEVGFDQIIKIDTEGIKTATGNLLEGLGKLRDNLLEAEQDAYNKYLYDLFRKQEQELMLADNNENKKKKIKEKYAQDVEVAEMNHQENLLGIDVAFGIKGQSELEKQQERRAQYLANKRKEELDERFKVIDKIVALEKQAADILMQYLNEGYAEQDRMSQDRYDKKIALIDAEKKAYDDSIANRTAAEQQALDIEEEYALRKQQAEDERKREQNEIAKKQFEANRNNAIAQVVIDYGVAIAKAFMTFGWPAALIPSAWLTAQSALQVGLIASQDFVPTFATGGLVTGPGGPKDDKIPAMLSNGEVVINAKSSKMYAPILSAINEAGGGVPIPNIGPSKADEIMTAAEGGVAEFTPSDRKNTPIVYGFSGPLVVGLDKTTMSELNQIMKSKDQTVSIQENTISNAQDKKAKVDSRTKF